MRSIMNNQLFLMFVHLFAVYKAPMTNHFIIRLSISNN